MMVDHWCPATAGTLVSLLLLLLCQAKVLLLTQQHRLNC
jgi:hypothetical protein